MTMRKQLLDTTDAALFVWNAKGGIQVYEVVSKAAEGTAWLRADEATAVAREILRAEGWTVGRLTQTGG
jgi:hypothetical protein